MLRLYEATSLKRSLQNLGGSGYSVPFRIPHLTVPKVKSTSVRMTRELREFLLKKKQYIMERAAK